MPRGRRGAQPPYGIIWGHLKEGEIVPFLGAGASRSTPKGASQPSQQPPGGRELAMELAEEAGFPSRDRRDRGDLLKVASYYQETGDRPALLKRLREVFIKEYPCGPVHEFLASIPKPILIVTTNYDDLIERAFLARKKPYHLVVHPTDRSDLAASVLWWEPGASKPRACPPAELPLTPLRHGTIIYKMHGTVHRPTNEWDSFVVTEDDYVDFLARMTGGLAVPAKFKAHFRSSRFLFLGYGLGDWNLRVMMKNLRGPFHAAGGKRISGSQVVEAMRLKDEMEVPTRNNHAKRRLADETELKSWAIQYKPSDLELKLWRARQVDIYDLKVDDFIQDLARFADAGS